MQIKPKNQQVQQTYNVDEKQKQDKKPLPVDWRKMELNSDAIIPYGKHSGKTLQ